MTWKCPDRQLYSYSWLKQRYNATNEFRAVFTTGENPRINPGYLNRSMHMLYERFMNFQYYQRRSQLIVELPRIAALFMTDTLTYTNS